jgi:hypothetical protein
MSHNGQWLDGDEPVGEYFDKHGVDLGRGDGDPDVWGYPGQPRWVGEDRAVVERHYEVKGRGEGYPFNEDIDYDPRLDEDRSGFNE